MILNLNFFIQYSIVHLFWGFPGDSEVKEFTSNAGDPGSIPGSGRSPGEGNGNPFQYSCLENPMDGEAQQVTVHGVAKSRTRLSDFTFIVHFYQQSSFIAGFNASFPGSSAGKNPPAMQETLVQFLGQEDPLEKEKATHSSILSWRIPWTVQCMRSQRIRHN